LEGRRPFGEGKRIMEEQEENRIKEKLNFFYIEKCKVHVSRFDKTFWRGLIVGKKSDDVFIFDEDKLGECLLFVADIHDVNLFREVRE
jgi:hypothetical protein